MAPTKLNVIFFELATERNEFEIKRPTNSFSAETGSWFKEDKSSSRSSTYEDY